MVNTDMKIYIQAVFFPKNRECLENILFLRDLILLDMLLLEMYCPAETFLMKKIRQIIIYYNCLYKKRTKKYEIIRFEIYFCLNSL